MEARGVNAYKKVNTKVENLVYYQTVSTKNVAGNMYFIYLEIEYYNLNLVFRD